MMVGIFMTMVLLMTTMSNLPEELVREILSRVPLTSLRKLRCTCRTWNALSKTQVFGKETARNQFLGFTVINGRVCSLRLDFQGIHNKGDLVHKSTKKIKVTSWCGTHIWGKPPSRDFRFYDMFCFGYDKNNRNHKILRFCYDNDESLFCFELFDFKTSSWRLLDIEPDVDLDVYRSGVSLKGNTYFVAQTNRPGVVDVLLCFDFTTERFWRPLPFHYDAVEHVVLSCVREEKLAVLYQIENTMEIWITTKIEYDDVSWSKFLEVEMTPLNGFDYDFDTETESFFIDEDKKFAVVGGECENKPICSATRNQPTEQEETQRLLLSKETKETESFFIDEEKEVAVGETYCYQTAHITGQDGYLKSVSVAEAPECGLDELFVISSYVPSLVQLGINQCCKREHKDCFYQ
ncbi:hypothetical protein IGI04_035333, partial [Brassica rapa subsp. trilocularis]